MKFLLILSICFLFSSHVFAADGVITVKSKFTALHTVDRLNTIITKKGLTVFANVDHEKGAKEVKIEMLPTHLVIFGNPKIGSPLMTCARSLAVDLPQKMLVWQDRAGQVWLSYNDPVYIADRHSLNKDCRQSLKKISNVLASLAKAAGGS